jgi:hypothetical protein
VEAMPVCVDAVRLLEGYVGLNLLVLIRKWLFYKSRIISFTVQNPHSQHQNSPTAMCKQQATIRAGSW